MIMLVIECSVANPQGVAACVTLASYIRVVVVRSQIPSPAS